MDSKYGKFILFFIAAIMFANLSTMPIGAKPSEITITIKDALNNKPYANMPVWVVYFPQTQTSALTVESQTIWVGTTGTDGKVTISTSESTTKSTMTFADGWYGVFFGDSGDASHYIGAVYVNNGAARQTLYTILKEYH